MYVNIVTMIMTATLLFILCLAIRSISYTKTYIKISKDKDGHVTLPTKITIIFTYVFFTFCIFIILTNKIQLFWIPCGYFFISIIRIIIIRLKGKENNPTP